MENQEKQPPGSIEQAAPEVKVKEAAPVLTDKEIARAVRKGAFPTWKDLLAVVGIFISSNVLMAILIPPFFGGQMTGLATFLTYAGTFAVTIPFALVLTKQRTGTVKNILHFTFKGFNPAVILWGLILMLAVSIVIEPLINLFPAGWYKMIEDQITTGGWVMFTAVVMAPVCEEVLFRGILQDSLVRKRGPWGGILIASAIFGLIHFVPQQVVAGFCLGIIIGFVYYKTRSLLSVIVLHAINNALATFLSLFQSEEGRAELTLRETIGNDTVYWVVFIVSILLLVLSLVQVTLSIRKGKEREKRRAEEKAQA